jgi:nitrate reductase gamma subunit
MCLAGAVVLGSRRLQNFDGALVAYLFGTLFACFGVVYRYSVWLQRPPTRLFWRRGWQLLLRRPGYVIELARRLIVDVVVQRFILQRGARRGVAHLLVAWGCVLGFAITLPLTFGWVYFGLKAGTLDTYQAYVFGVRLFDFPLHTAIALSVFHALNAAAVLIIIGGALMLRRRLTDGGLIATQTFEGDWLPILLLLAVSVTGLGITWDYEMLRGKAHQYMAITHAVTVILFLAWLPFGKLFHIFQRPAQLGVALYVREGVRGPQAVCPHTSAPFAPRMQIDDLERVTRELGYDYDLAAGGSHLGLSPQGKRAALARAHLTARKRSGAYFG